MATRSARLDEFVTDADPPLDALVELLCEDHVGTYLLPYLCRSTAAGFQNERSADLIEGRVVGWRAPQRPLKLIRQPKSWRAI